MSLNIVSIEPCPFVHWLNEDFLGSCFFFLLGIVLGDGNTEMNKHRIYLKEIWGNDSGRQLEVEWSNMLSWYEKTLKHLGAQSAGKLEGPGWEGCLSRALPPSTPYLFMHKILSPLQRLPWYSILLVENSLQGGPHNMFSGFCTFQRMALRAGESIL